MKQRSARWVYAAKVASVATAVVAAVAVVAALVLNAVFVNHLSHDIDVRLAARLTNPSEQVHNPPRGQGDLDDPPSFVWKISPSGVVTPLTSGAPRLPPRRWSPGTTTQELAGTKFRLDAKATAGGRLVAGESVLKISQARSDLLLIEALLGALLLMMTFTGSFVVGLRASAPIEEIRKRQAEFTADASHELRTPLSVIEAEVDLALSRPRNTPSYQATLRRIGSESGRLRSIVEDLLWLARADGQLPERQRSETVDVGSVALACAERFQAVADASSISLSCSADLLVATIQADADAMDRLVSVLLDNACRYAGTGGIVEVRVTHGGGRVGLSVEDSGPGIPEEHRELVFDRFHRVGHGTGGTGLGLAIADAVVRTSGGTWSIGRSPLGGVRMGVSWHRATGPSPGLRRPVGEEVGTSG
jgi:signal transduction histidine kinase